MDLPSSGASARVTDTGAYTDLNRLAALKTGDKNSQENLRKVAREFESLFTNEMLKSMRSATDVFAKDDPFNSEAAKQYQDMYDQQLSVSLSHQGNGIGLQDVLMRQLSKQAGHTSGEEATAASAAANHSLQRGDNSLHRSLGAVRNTSADVKAAQANSEPRNDVAKLNARRLSLPGKLADRLLAGIVPSATATASTDTSKNRIDTSGIRSGKVLVEGLTPEAQAMAQASGVQTYATPDSSGVGTTSRSMAQIPLAPKKAFTSKDDFVNTMLPLAKDAAARIGVDPTVLVAQAALETGWGKSIMRQGDGENSHNLFGIKATGNWQGGQARAITSEFRDGQMVKETAEFRAYDSYADSFHDLVSLLQNNNRYQDVVKSADNPEQFVRELQKAGYATDPNYASKISAIAKQMKSFSNYAQAESSRTL